MKKSIAAWMCLIFIAGCGGAAYRTSSYEPAPEESATAPDYGAGTDDREMVQAEADFAFVDEGIESALASPPPAPPARAKKNLKADVGRARRPSSATKQPTPTLRQEPADKDEAKSRDVDSPMVVYTGYLKLRVKRLLQAVDEVTRITEEMGGYIESLAQRVIIVRIPAEDFDEVMATFAGIGELLDRRIKASDVTAQFTDLGSRLAVAREARERLLRLLETVEDVEERLRILQEIKRLSEQIESIESTLAALKNLVDYFTITIELKPVLEDSGGPAHRSPFAWVRDLVAHRTSIYDGKDDFSLRLPPDFVLFEKDDEYRAQAADTTVIRGGVVDNEPLGNNAFWADAVHHEMEGRAEKLVAEGDAGPMTYRLYRSEDVMPRYYLVAVSVDGDDLYIVEVFYPNEDAYKAHHEKIIESLATFEVE